MFKFLIVFIFFQLFLQNIIGIDWCSIEELYCNGTRHIACENSNYINGVCLNGSLINMTKYKKTITKQHNRYRNDIADGKIYKFPAASRMRLMHWDTELANLAEMHAKNCIFDHDECRATENYPYAGQNLAIYSTSNENEDFNEILMNSIGLWFEEHIITPKSYVKEIKPDNISDVGHFTVMMRENNVALGCAAYKYNKNDNGFVWYNYLITCNYADNNIIGEKMYTRGRPCSQCRNIYSVCSNVYKNLCK